VNIHGPKEAVKIAQDQGESWNVKPELLAAMPYVSNALIQSAKNALPREFNRPDGESKVDQMLLPMKSLKLPVSPFTLAREWKSSSERRQLEIGQLLVKNFWVRHEEDYSSVDDRLDQPAERVLPAHYGRWDSSRGGNRANCLGKALMVAGFGDLAGAKMLGVIPMVTEKDLIWEKRADAADAALAELQAAGVPLDYARNQALKCFGEWHDAVMDPVSWMHMAIAFRLKKGAWMLVDPNMGVVGLYPGYWHLDRVHDLLTRSAAVLPGLSVTGYDSSAEVDYDLAVDLCKLNGRATRELAARIIGKGLTKEQIVQELMRSSFLDHLLQWVEFQPSELPANSSRRKKAICALLEFVLEEEESRRSESTKPLKVLWFASVHRSEDWLLSKITDQEANEAVITMCYSFATRGIRLMGRGRAQDSFRAELVHPACQFILPQTALAVPVFAHIALAMGRDVAEQVELMLNEHAFDMYRLTYGAAAPLRGAAALRPDWKCSLEILREHKVRPQSAEIVLDAFSSASRE
jgi:hypothetical protein